MLEPSYRASAPTIADVPRATSHVRSGALRPIDLALPRRSAVLSGTAAMTRP